RVQELLEELSSRNGWFCTVSELLDWLRARQASPELSEREWRRIQRIWLLNLLSRRLTAKWTKLRQRLPIAASPLPSTRYAKEPVRRTYPRLVPAQAKSSQESISVTPPSGVTGPSQRAPVSTIV